MLPFIGVIGGLVLLAFLVLLFLVSRYKRCPSDRILVVYGRTGGGRSARCIHGGAAFVWPVIQDYAFLELTPISIDVDLQGALSRQNIRVDVPSRFTVGISDEEGVMTNAADRLLGLQMDSIRDLAHDIIVGQMRLVIAMMDIEEINADRDKFYNNVASNVGLELKKIGLKLINVNVTDIKDESGYIRALGQEAAAQAINEAKKIVAEKNRDGSIGQALAQRDQNIQVAEAESQAINESKRIVAEKNRDGSIGEANAQRDQRIKVAEAESLAAVGEAKANAEAIEGKNTAQIAIAKSNALRREQEAEALRLATAAEKIQTAKALEESYRAEEDAEKARAAREMARQEADAIVNAEIAKRKLEIEAEAEAEQRRRIARGEADAIYSKKEAEARGLYELLSKQAEGFEKLVNSAGNNSRDAVLLMIADKLPELVKTQVEAIKNIKIDKVTVWEGGNQKEGDGNSTSKFISGLYKSVPPMNDLFNMAGMDLPQYLGNTKPQEVEAVEVKEEKKKG